MEEKIETKKCQIIYDKPSLKSDEKKGQKKGDQFLGFRTFWNLSSSLSNGIVRYISVCALCCVWASLSSRWHSRCDRILHSIHYRRSARNMQWCISYWLLDSTMAYGIECSEESSIAIRLNSLFTVGQMAGFRRCTIDTFIWTTTKMVKWEKTNGRQKWNAY